MHFVPGIFISFTLLGCCLGFLVFNWHPAKIFTGDCGSLFLGFMFAVLAILLSPEHFDIRLIAAPLLIIGVPIFDTFFTVLRRLINKNYVFTGDRRHIYDLLMNMGFNYKKTVLIMYGLGILLGLSGILIIHLSVLFALLLILMEVSVLSITAVKIGALKT